MRLSSASVEMTFLSSERSDFMSTDKHQHQRRNVNGNNRPDLYQRRNRSYLPVWVMLATDFSLDPSLAATLRLGAGGSGGVEASGVPDVGGARKATSRDHLNLPLTFYTEERA